MIIRVSNAQKIRSWKQRMRERKITQHYLAGKLGISQNYFSEVLNGIYDPRASFVDKVEEILKSHRTKKE